MEGRQVVIEAKNRTSLSTYTWSRSKHRCDLRCTGNGQKPFAAALGAKE
jgi:hypothetical protein